MIIEDIKMTKVIKCYRNETERDRNDKNCKFDYIHNFGQI